MWSTLLTVLIVIVVVILAIWAVRALTSGAPLVPGNPVAPFPGPYLGNILIVVIIIVAIVYLVQKFL